MQTILVILEILDKKKNIFIFKILRFGLSKKKRNDWCLVHV